MTQIDKLLIKTLYLCIEIVYLHRDTPQMMAAASSDRYFVLSR
ncbi:MAG: hypothetical protein PUC18_09135 [Prevotellaceae bacterium]|nr:hypothetical protein [Prevotellaceae bacterium]